MASSARRGSAWLALALVALTSQDAPAQVDPCQPPDGISTCVPSDNLWPYAGGGRWLAQAPTQTASELSASFGLQLGYIHRPIGLEVASTDPDGTTIYAVEHVFGATLMTAFGVTDRFQVQLTAPFVLFQDGATKADIIGSDDFLPRSAVGDFRFGATLSLLPRGPDEDGPGLAARFEMSAPTGLKEAFVSSPSAAYAPGVSFDYRVGRFFVGADAGARVRSETEIAGTIVGSQISGALGLGVEVLDDGWLSFQGEAFALFTLIRGTEDVIDEEGESIERARQAHIPAEWLLSARTAGALDGRLRVTAGGGSFIPTGDELLVTTPAFRVLAALHYLHD
jgi:hypothetical protein